MNSVPTKRRWYQFSLRAFLIAVFVFAVVCGWLVLKARQQERAVAAIRAAGAEVGYDHSSERRVPEWLVRWLGVDFFDSVTSLHVYKNSSLGDADLELFQSLPELQCVYIDRTSIGDAGMKHLRGLTQIEFLYLDRTCITDEGTESLESLSHLRELDLSKTQITDASIAHLKKLPHLQLLNVRDTNITPRGVQELKQALPDLNVVR